MPDQVYNHRVHIWKEDRDKAQIASWAQGKALSGPILIYKKAKISRAKGDPEEESMDHETVELAGKQAHGYVIPLGPVNLVAVVTEVGMVGCGAFDVMALNSFGYPAARVRPSEGSSISNIEDLLEGIVKEANPAAEKRGVKIGMSGREALSLI